MSFFSKNAKIEKKVVVTFFYKKYVTASGLARMLSDVAAQRLMERFGRNDKKRYGVPHYSDPKGVRLWKENISRIRKKFYRRILPHIEKVFV
jgi:hypothetical protein